MTGENVFTGNGKFGSSESVSLTSTCQEQAVPSDDDYTAFDENSDDDDDDEIVETEIECIEAVLSIFTDEYPTELTVLLEDRLAREVYWTDTNIDEAYTLYEFRKCIDPTGCHRVEILDSYGDGLCCLHGTGAFDLMYGDIPIGGGSSFGESAVYELGTGC